jgi:hypothetical protein
MGIGGTGAGTGVIGDGVAITGAITTGTAIAEKSSAI